jgi:protein ImuB
MERLACVDVPSLALQVLLKAHPEWRGRPLALVAEDKPHAKVLQVNEPARRLRILPGLRYAAALSLSRELHAGTVAPAEIERALGTLVERLRRFTPDVEPSRELPGVFWLDASGLERLHPSRPVWARQIHDELAAAGFVTTVVVGFTRFGTYAVARASRGATVFEQPGEEQRAAADVRLKRLDLDPAVRDALTRLGVTNVGEWRRLPAGGLRLRFGEEAHRLHALASGTVWAPLLPQPAEEPLEREVDFEHPESDAERLLFLLKRLLDELLRELHARAAALGALRLELRLDGGGRHSEALRPAAPTLDSAQLLGLVRLRLEALRRQAQVGAGEGKGIVALRLHAEGVRAPREQLELFAQLARRDRAAAERALARLRAEFGDGVVVRARLREAHLPAARFAWEPLVSLKGIAPAPRRVAPRPLVRRLYAPPLPLPHRPRREPDGWLLRGLEHGRVTRFIGPYLLSGGWWKGEGAQREYSFAEMQSGELLWIYYDARRRRWLLEGRVE